ncbi:tyrosine-type recombinase/integrase [Litorivicinus sp.]|nr:tyrosine-type recombinase/integrase [Litorivicinus sp.]
MAIANKLTQKQISQTEGPIVLNDGNGLYIRFRSTGYASWFCRIRHPQSKKLIDKVFGHFPEMSLRQARNELDKVKNTLLANCFNEQSYHPSVSFQDYAERYIDRKEAEWRNQKHRQQWRNTLRDYVYPVLGSLKINEVNTELVLAILDPIWRTKTETATRVRQRIEKILDGATVEGLFEKPNPARWRGHLSHILPDPNKIRIVKHQPAMSYHELPAFIALLRQREGLSARLLEFVISTACRQSEARLATYDEIDRDTRIWTIPASRMKTNREHRVPLTDRMLELIDDCLNDSAYLFAENGKPLSINALRMLMNRMGRGEYTPHGFRSSFRDWSAETDSTQFEVAEHCLAHYGSISIVKCYKRTDLLELRKCLLQQWLDFLEQHQQL